MNEAFDPTALIVGGGLLAAFWAGTNAVFAGTRQTNELRDRIVLGKIGDDPLTADYAWRLLLLDWLPMKTGWASISLVLGIIILLLPRLAGAESSQVDFRTACRVAAIVPFAGFLTFVASGVVEFRFMSDAIRRRHGGPGSGGSG
jgi:hypothetical protein